MKIFKLFLFASLCFILLNSYSQGIAPISVFDSYRYQKDTKGNDYDLVQMLEDGNAIYIEFFATWCGPCKLAAPKLENVWQSFGEGENKVYVFGFSVSEKENTSDSLIEAESTKWGSTFPRMGYQDGQNEQFFKDFGFTLLPTNLMLIPNQNKDSIYGFASVGYDDLLDETAIELFKSYGYNTIDDTETNINSLAEEVKEFSLYPNPMGANGYLTIHTKTRAYIEVSVFNYTGQKLKTLYTGYTLGNVGETIPINAHNIVNGMYLLQIKSSTWTESLRFQIVK